MNEASMQLLDLFRDNFPRDLKTAKKLLINGADVNSVDLEGNTPLLVELSTCFGTSKEGLDLLCKNGADIHHKNHRGQNALMLAARKAPRLIFDGKFPTPLNEFCSWLIKQGVDVSATDMDGNSAIHYAYGNKATLELLIKFGASIHQLNKKQQTLLHVPAGVYLSMDNQAKPQYGGIAPATLKWLLQQGLDANARDADGQTPLHAVSRINSDNPQKAAQVLVEFGADLGVADETGTPLSVFHLHAGNLKLAKWISAQAVEQHNAIGHHTQPPAKIEPAVEEASNINLRTEKECKDCHEIENKPVVNMLKVTKDIESQRLCISEAMTILEPVLSDHNVKESTKRRIRFALNITQPTYHYSLKETSPKRMDRLANMVGGWPYTSQKHPWPMHGDRPFPPFLQLNLKDISALSNKNLGDGLLQIWATHETSLIRVFDHADTQNAPSDECFDTGILAIGGENLDFDSIEFDQLPHARRNSIIIPGGPKPTVIPAFEACTNYGLDDEDLCDDYHTHIDRAIKLVKKYFARHTTRNLFGAQQFRQCGYGFYIDICINEGWRPLMCFYSDQCNFEFSFDGQGYLLYRIANSTTEFLFYWDR